MDWRLLLTKHRKSILEDEIPLLVLTFISKAGVITEADLKKSLNQFGSRLEPVLLKLHLNDLVSYGRNSVRATFRGHQILARLGINDQIIASILRDCAVPPSEIKRYSILLSAYGKYAHQQYQSSLCSIRQWHHFSSSLPIEANAKSIEATKQAGYFVLFRDLIHWLYSSGAYTSTSDEALKAAASECRDLLTKMSSQRLRRMSDTSNYWFLRAFYHPNPSPDVQWMPEQCVSVLPYIQCFHRFQSVHTPDDWFESWTEHIKFPDPNRFSVSRNYLKKLRKVLGISVSTSREIRGWEDYQRNWSPARSTMLNTGAILDSLLCAESLQEMSEKTGISNAALPEVVAQIRKACDRLLPG
ncbi:MAG TPA: hypothetical protein VG796_20685 [Verrucomicrobiales bacterium]|nr:hypothetical protein [Verrucomicrobiales bacterium]